MNRLIQDLLDTGRIEAGHFTVKCTSESPEAIARDAYDAFRPIAKERDQQRRCVSLGEVPPVYADRDRVVLYLPQA